MINLLRIFSIYLFIGFLITGCSKTSSNPLSIEEEETLDEFGTIKMVFTITEGMDKLSDLRYSVGLYPAVVSATYLNTNELYNQETIEESAHRFKLIKTDSIHTFETSNNAKGLLVSGLYNFPRVSSLEEGYLFSYKIEMYFNDELMHTETKRETVRSQISHNSSWYTDIGYFEAFYLVDGL